MNVYFSEHNTTIPLNICKRVPASCTTHTDSRGCQWLLPLFIFTAVGKTYGKTFCLRTAIDNMLSYLCGSLTGRTGREDVVSHPVGRGAPQSSPASLLCGLEWHSGIAVARQQEEVFSQAPLPSGDLQVLLYMDIRVNIDTGW